MAKRVGLGLALALVTPWPSALALPEPAATAAACLPAQQRQPLDLSAAEPAPPAAPAVAGDYRHLLRPTPAGWPVRDRWCVWIEPPQSEPGSGAGQRERQWAQAIHGALEAWGRELTLALVPDPQQAQVRIWRRRPPLQRLADGRLRASHGRALLSLEQVLRGDQWQIEPQVEVLLSPGQAPAPLQATALHELGHAFGLWAHSDAATDAMAAKPGPVPVLVLSPRDRATLRWLLDQPGRLSTAATRSKNPAAPQSPPPAPSANPALPR